MDLCYANIRNYVVRKMGWSYALILVIFSHAYPVVKIYYTPYLTVWKCQCL